MQNGGLRFGCHNFINSSPFTWSITSGLIEPNMEMFYRPPAQLAEMLKAGELDIAFIPAIEYARIENLSIMPDICIASRGAVDTVLLFSEKRVWDIESVAVDPRSRTSVALLKILFKEYFRTPMQTITATEAEPEQMLEKADAGLIIGDEAFFIDREKYKVIDLSQAWLAFTGKAFTFALICGRQGVNMNAAREMLLKSYSMGVQRLAEVAEYGAKNINLPADVIRNYLQNRIRFTLGNDEKEGLAQFLQLAADENLCPSVGELNFFGK